MKGYVAVGEYKDVVIQRNDTKPYLEKSWAL